MDMTEDKRVIAWLVGDDTGMSSETIAGIMSGVKVACPRTPGDINDLGRCMRLMALFPEWTQDRFITAMSKVSLEWRYLAEIWLELTDTYNREIRQERMPETYRLMRDAERRSIEDDPEVTILGRDSDGFPSFWSRGRSTTMRASTDPAP